MWLVFSLLTILFWGLWGFFIKLAARYLEWYQIYVLGNAAAFLLSGYFLVRYGANFVGTGRGLLLGLAAGVVGTLGYIFFILATKTGRVSIVVPLTAVYPAVTFILALLLLHEPFNLRHLVGMVLALAGAMLLSL